MFLKAIVSRGGRYLEAMIQGSKVEAEEGNLVFMAAGDKTLFDDCQSSFCAIAKNSFYLGKINIIIVITIMMLLCIVIFNDSYYNIIFCYF